MSDGIKVITPNERLYVTMSGVKFCYSRPTPDEIQELQDKHTSRGETDHRAFRTDLFNNHIHGWEGNIHDENGTVEFDAAILVDLPGSIQMSLAETLTENVDGEDSVVDPT